MSKKRIDGGQQILLYNLKLKFFHGKLNFRWSFPLKLIKVHPYGVMDLLNGREKGNKFKVNGIRVKIYLGDPLSMTRSTIDLDN